MAKISECPVETTLNLINTKWKILILKHLLTGTKRFNELKRLLNGISVKVLVEQLKGLEKDKIIIRKEYYQVPLKVEYYLSDIGWSLSPILDAMKDWGTKYKNNELDLGSHKSNDSNIDANKSKEVELEK